MILGHDNNNAQIELVVDEADDANIDDPMPTELPKKQKFKNLEEVLDEDNYVDLPTQRKCTIKYADAKKYFKDQLEIDSKLTIISTTCGCKHFETQTRF